MKRPTIRHAAAPRLLTKKEHRAGLKATDQAMQAKMKRISPKPPPPKRKKSRAPLGQQFKSPKKFGG